MKSKTSNDFAAVGKAFIGLCNTIAALRHPETGCPWDLEQTHDSLRRFMIEEAYEAAQAMKDGDAKAICDELGDVLLQVVLNAQVATDHAQFGIVDVIRAIDEKMRRRHPHVFTGDVKVKDANEVRRNWEDIKASEKPRQNSAHYFAPVEKQVPASLQALAIGKLAKKINFDWSAVGEVKAQFFSEIKELKDALQDAKDNSSEHVYAEMGDVYFTLAQLSRHLGYDPEVVALDGNQKFLARFRTMELLATKPISEHTQAELEALWLQAKETQKK